MTICKLDSPSTLQTSALQDWGTVGLPMGEPVCTLRGEKMVLPLEGRPEVGIWECSPGSYRRQVRSAETMHVISGSALFTPDNGTPVALRRGDVYFFPAETTGVWDVQLTMRKVYVLFNPH